MANFGAWRICFLVFFASVVLSSGVTVSDEDVMVTHAQQVKIQQMQCLAYSQNTSLAMASTRAVACFGVLIIHCTADCQAAVAVEVVESFTSNFISRHSFVSTGNMPPISAALACPMQKHRSVEYKDRCFHAAAEDCFLKLNSQQDGDPPGCTSSPFINSSYMHVVAQYSDPPLFPAGTCFWILKILCFLSLTLILTLFVYHAFLSVEIEQHLIPQPYSENSPSLTADASSTGRDRCCCYPNSEDVVLNEDTVESREERTEINDPVSEWTEDLRDLNGNVLLELDSPLSTGRKNKVYRGIYCQKAVVVKVALKTGTSTEAVREPKEVKFLKALRPHPHIVNFIMSGSYVPSRNLSRRASGDEWIRDAKLPFETLIVMEYCDRGTLHDAMKTATKAMTRIRSFSQVSVCALEIAHGMTHLHSKRTIHGALHTQHILLQSSQTHPKGFVCKIGGFGSSVRLPRGSSFLQSHRVPNITIASPELLKSGTLSTASDVYAFGILLYTMCLQRSPFRGMRSTEIRRLIVAGQRPSIPATFPPFLSKLIRDCWCNNALERPPFSKIAQELAEHIYRSPTLLSPLPSLCSGSACHQPTSDKINDLDFYLHPTLVPGKRYVDINFRPTPKSGKSACYMHAAVRRRERPRSRWSMSGMTSFGIEGSQETSHKAYVRQVDSLLKRSQLSGSKAELREFLSRIKSG